MTGLPDAPSNPWSDDGSIAFGTYRGECGAVPLDKHYSRLTRVRAQKRWLWCGAFTPDVAIGLAIVRTGYAANVFCWVFDRNEREFVVEISRVAPRALVEVCETPPLQGRVARYNAVVESVAVERDGDIWRVSGTVGDAHLDLRIVEHAPASTAICPSTDPTWLNVTRKQALASASGFVRVGTRRIEIEGGGLLDHSHGMLSGETIWHWGIGAGRFVDSGEPFAFNVVAKFNDGLENTVWIDGEPGAAGTVEFEIPQDRSGPWRIRGERMNLELAPEGLRAQDLDLVVIASDYLQPLGVWKGTVDGRAVEATGVAELHRSVW